MIISNKYLFLLSSLQFALALPLFMIPFFFYFFVTSILPAY